MTVLSFGEIIKIDLALLDAGLICKELGMKGNAIILLNRYLDVFDAIEENTNVDEESELNDTEIPQKDLFMSDKNIIDSNKKNEIHEWIVKANIDKSFEKSLNRKPCINCNKMIFEANIRCKSCKHQYEQCIISGFPIYKGNEAVSCSNCGKKSIKECWNEWINENEQCPWCKSVQMNYK